MTYCIPLGISWESLFNDNFFGNNDWNYYHQKPETWYVNEKIQVSEKHRV